MKEGLCVGGCPPPRGHAKGPSLRRAVPLHPVSRTHLNCELQRVGGRGVENLVYPNTVPTVRKVKGLGYVRNQQCSAPQNCSLVWGHSLGYRQQPLPCSLGHFHTQLINITAPQLTAINKGHEVYRGTEWCSRSMDAYGRLGPLAALTAAPHLVINFQLQPGGTGGATQSVFQTLLRNLTTSS